jgi:hypothetical protein
VLITPIKIILRLIELSPTGATWKYDLSTSHYNLLGSEIKGDADVLRIALVVTVLTTVTA